MVQDIIGITNVDYGFSNQEEWVRLTKSFDELLAYLEGISSHSEYMELDPSIHKSNIDSLLNFKKVAMLDSIDENMKKEYWIMDSDVARLEERLFFLLAP